MTLAAFLPEGWEYIDFMSPVNAVVLVFVFLCAAFGFWRGFIWETLWILALMVAFWVAAKFHVIGAQQVLPQDWDEPTRLLTSYGILLLAPLFVAHVALHWFRRPINALKPEASDRALGAVFGVIKGLLVCGMISLALLTHAPQQWPAREACRKGLPKICATGVSHLWLDLAGEGGKTLRSGLVADRPAR